MNDFDSWNNVKKQVNLREIEVDRYPKESEVWMTTIGKNIGFEQNGSGDNFSRPVLVIKKFNNQMFWCVPLSTKPKKFDFYFNFSDPNKKEVSAILAQLKLLSIKRFNRHMYTMDNQIFSKIRSKLIQLL